MVTAGKEHQGAATSSHRAAAAREMLGNDRRAWITGKIDHSAFAFLRHGGNGRIVGVENGEAIRQHNIDHRAQSTRELFLGAQSAQILSFERPAPSDHAHVEPIGTKPLTHDPWHARFQYGRRDLGIQQ
jgi:hypothetical protein